MFIYHQISEDLEILVLFVSWINTYVTHINIFQNVLSTFTVFGDNNISIANKSIPNTDSLAIKGGI